MQKRKYTHMKHLDDLIESMRQSGMTLREIANELGFSYKQLRDWSYRHNREKRTILLGMLPKPKGRPRKDGQPPKQNIEAEIKQLRDGKQVIAGFSAIHRKDVRPKIKYAVIYRHRGEYPVAVMCKFFGVSRSGYYDFVKRMEQTEHDADLAKEIEICQNKTDKTYGYRRVWKWQKDRNIERNPKTVLRIMKKYGLLSEIRRRRKWVNLGQQVHKYENLLAQQFHADRPNTKWVTDISYIHTKEGVLYLSMIRDLYNNSIVAYKTSTQQTVSLVLDTIRLAMKKEKKRVAAELQLHSDQGFQYTSYGYFKLTQSYGTTPSMSRKGNPYDNAMAENFFSILKTECIYRHKPKPFKDANALIDRYIHFYNHERIQLKTGVAPLSLRHSS